MSAQDIKNIGGDELRVLFGKMLLIRRFEEKVIEMFAGSKVVGSLHSSIGQEAVAAGVISNLRKDDYVVGNHRGHGHLIAKGADLNKMMAELFGKAGGYSKGKSGSMHMADVAIGHFGTNGIVGGGLSIVQGLALASQMKGTDQVSACFFGDGALNIGIFHEALNLGSLWKLPVVYICENNQYAISTPVKKATAAADLVDRSRGYDMPGSHIDGMDVLAVKEASRKAVDRARSGKGPSLMVCDTYRFYGHSMNDARNYRTKKEEEDWKTKCPVKAFREKLIESGVLTASETAKIEQAIAQKLQAAVDFAEQSPYLDPQELEKYVYSD